MANLLRKLLMMQHPNCKSLYLFYDVRDQNNDPGKKLGIKP